MTVKKFRILVLADMLILLFYIGIGYFGDPFLGGEWADVETAALEVTPKWLDGLAMLLLLPQMILYTAGVVLLWQMRSVGRYLYSASWLLGTLLVALTNYSIVSGPLLSLDCLAGLVSAGVIILPFVSPLRERFETTPSLP